MGDIDATPRPIRTWKTGREGCDREPGKPREPRIYSWAEAMLETPGGCLYPRTLTHSSPGGTH